MKKKFIVCLIFALLIPLSFSACSQAACTRELRIDRHELSLRLEKIDKSFSIVPEDIIIENEKQLYFFSLKTTDDCLLTLVFDTSKRIQSLSLSLDRAIWKAEDMQNTFQPFCKEVLNAFCTDETLVEEAIKELELDKANAYKTNKFKSVEIENFMFNLYTNDLSHVIECSYI